MLVSPVGMVTLFPGYVNTSRLALTWTGHAVGRIETPGVQWLDFVPERVKKAAHPFQRLRLTVW